jgi:YndJ-like protein
MNPTVDMRADQRLRKHCRYSAFLGTAIWLSTVWFLPGGTNGIIAALLLFVPLVLIRLGFAFIIPYGGVKRYRLWYIVSYSQLPAAIALTGAFLLAPATSAALLAIPWLGFSLLLAYLAIDRIVQNPRPAIDEWGQLAAMLFLPVGAFWALLACGGLQPLGFRDVIVLLTAVHFHYAGFALPLMAGALVRHRRDEQSKEVLLAVLAGVPLTAIGITATQIGGPREIELLAAGLLAAAGIALGFYHVRLGLAMRRFTGLLMAVSGFSLVTALGWSALYAAGQYGLIPRIEIPFMVHWHGAINAVGAALCGLFAWHLVITGKHAPAERLSA